MNSQLNGIPTQTLVALCESPEHFDRGEFQVVPAHLAKVSAFDRSFHFGDSVYEVARTYQGIIFGFDLHEARLLKSASMAGFSKVARPGVIEKMIRATCAQWFREFGNQDVYIRWTLSRGLSDLNINPDISTSPLGMVFVKPLPTQDAQHAADFERGLHYAVVERLRNNPAALDPRMKSGNYLNNILGLAEAHALGADDAIMLDHHGNVTEGTTNNVFAVKNGTIYTAPLSVGILDGITRRLVFATARTQGIPLSETTFNRDFLKSADEIFMSSSIKEILPITMLNGLMVGPKAAPGAVTRKIAGGFAEEVKRFVTEHRTESLFL